MAPPFPIEKLGWLKAFISWTPKRRLPPSQSRVFLNKDRLTLLTPGVVTFPRPVWVNPTPIPAPASPLMNWALGFRATYPTTFAFPPHAAAVAAIVGDVPLKQTKFDALPVRSVPPGFSNAERAPKARRLPPETRS